MRALVIAALCLLPIPAMAQSVASQTSAPASSLSVAGTHTLNGFTIIAPSAGRVMIFDALAAPSDGAVAPGACWKVPVVGTGDTSAMVAMGNVPSPSILYTGITVVFSDSLSCYTLHKASAEYILINYG